MNDGRGGLRPPRPWTRRAFAATTVSGVAGATLSPLRALAPADDWLALVLGSIQDGGLPQAGCYSSRCDLGRRDPHFVASLGITNPATGRAWLIDATPDLIRQMDLFPGEAFRERARKRRPFEGILLTHAHIGHYLGLALLGREGLGIESTPCYCSGRMAAFLSSNGPWNLLVDEGRLDLRVLEPERATRLAAELSVTALAVPHRDEYADTLGFIVEGPCRSLLYLPDIDRWDRWERRIEEVVSGVDLAFLDGSFYSRAELPGRDQEDVPHPLVRETMDRLRHLTHSRSIVLTHLNNTNPVLDPESPERASVLAAGFGIARAGQSYKL